jgi:hypothetical protein
LDKGNIGCGFVLCFFSSFLDWVFLASPPNLSLFFLSLSLACWILVGHLIS